MKRSSLNAVRLRLMLSISLFLIAAIGIGLFYIVYANLASVADSVSKVIADANVSQNNLQTLQTLERELEKDKAAVQRAGSLVANSQNYQYQNQLINDLNAYAAREEITLTNISFATRTGGASPQASAPAGLSTATITVTVKNPIPYVNFLRFLKDIEQNLTKMQIAKVNLSQGETGISSDALEITLYVK